MSALDNSPIPDAIRRIANSDDRQLAWEFFIFFSRFEYALKRDKRYLKPGTGNAEPNWDRFASDHDNSFNPNSSSQLGIAVDFFLASPPRKQLRENGKMKWSEPIIYNEQEPLLIWLVTVIRTIRNNLFHGGKFPLIPISDPSRDRDLLTHAITILDALLLLDRVVRQKFVDEFVE